MITVNRQDQADTDYVMERAKSNSESAEQYNRGNFVTTTRRISPNWRILQKEHRPKLNINFASVPENLRLGDAFNVFLTRTGLLLAVGMMRQKV